MQAVEEVVTPVDEQYAAFQRMFDYLNYMLFNRTLPLPMLAFNNIKGAVAAFRLNAWYNDEQKKLYEICLCPDCMPNEDIRIAQDFTHELCHLWQEVFGKPSKGNYHNMEFSVKMEEVGLMTSTTGHEGGKLYGRKMSDYIIPGGRFEHVFKQMPAQCLLPWKSLKGLARGVIKNPSRIVQIEDELPEIAREVNSLAEHFNHVRELKKKTTYICQCGQHIYGQEGKKAICELCLTRFKEKDESFNIEDAINQDEERPGYREVMEKLRGITEELKRGYYAQDIKWELIDELRRCLGMFPG